MLQKHHKKFVDFLKSKGAWGTVITDFSSIVNVKEFADTIILVNNGKEQIFAHSVFLLFRLKNWHQLFEYVPTEEEKPGKGLVINFDNIQLIKRTNL